MSKSVARKKKAKAEETANNEVDDLQSIVDRMISEEYIMKVTGTMDLTQVERLELVVDTSVQSVFGLNEMLPNLKHLSLDKSVIGTVRDLGSGLRSIISLSLVCCGLSDLDGIGVLMGLQELNLKDNNISDVAPLAMHENLQSLNVSGNKLVDISIGDALSSCPNLKSLFLTKNTITRAPNYRIIMSSLIPSLEMLDGAPVSHAASRAKVTNGMILEAASAMRLIEEEMDDDQRLEGDILGAELGAPRPSPASPLKTVGASGWKQGGVVPNTGSELTHGSTVVLAGGMAAAMRQRRNNSSNRGSRDESALEALDAPHAYDATQFMKEGDITALTLSQVRAEEVEFDTDYLSNPQTNRSGGPLSGRYQQSPRVDSARGSSGKFFDGEDTPSRPRTASAKAEPRQINSSRPQSAISTTMSRPSSGIGSSGKLITSFSIPFKVGDTTEPAERSRPPSGSQSVSSSARHSRNSSRDFEVEEAEVSSPNRKASSIVHLDIVKRHPSRTTPSAVDDVETIPLDEDEGDSSSDAENIAVTHAARHRLMSASATSTTAAANKTRNQVLSQLFSASKPTAGEPSAAVDLPAANSRKPPIKPLTPGGTAAFKAGKSLGFNLAGSLAAIDQWVHDMNSEDESDASKPKESGGLRSQPSESLLEEAGTPRSATQKILSRDAIINMCVGTSTKIPSSSSNSSRRGGDSDSDEEDDFRGSRRPAKMFLGDSRVPLNANVSTLLNKVNGSPVVPKPDPVVRTSSGSASGSSRKPSDNIVITKESPKPKSKAPLPEPSRLVPTASVVKRLEALDTAVEVSPKKGDNKFGVVAEDSSPPRFTAESNGRNGNCGSGVYLSDLEIVQMLRKPPKETVELRTKGSFATYFRGISAARMKKLLAEAYADIESVEDRDTKVSRRMELLVDVVP